MRTKKIDGTQRIILTIEEANQISQILDDYSTACTISGYSESCSNTELNKLIETLGETINTATTEVEVQKIKDKANETYTKDRG